MELKRSQQEIAASKLPLSKPAIGGLAGWLVERIRGSARARPRLRMVERIALAPRQSLALVEAEGRRFLVATSADGAAAFYSLDERGRAAKALAPASANAKISSARVSW